MVSVDAKHHVRYVSPWSKPGPTQTALATATSLSTVEAKIFGASDTTGSPFSWYQSLSHVTIKACRGAEAALLLVARVV